MSVLSNILNTSYTVGSKSSSSVGGVPVNVQLKLDPDFKKTILITGGVLAGSILLGVIISKIRR